MSKDLILAVVVAAMAVLACLFLVLLLLWMGKGVEASERWRERIERMPRGRRIALSILLTMFWVLLGTVSCLFLYAIIRADQARPQRAPMAEAERMMESLREKLEELEGLQAERYEKMRESLYRGWKQCENEKARRSFRRKLIATAAEGPDVLLLLFIDATDPAYRSDLAFVLQRILEKDWGVREGGRLSTERLDALCPVIRREVERRRAAEPAPTDAPAMH